MDWRAWEPPDAVTSGRVGVHVTVAILAFVILDLALLGTVPGPVAIGVLLAIAAAGVLGHRLDWKRLASRPAGTLLPYLWTTAGIVGWVVYVGFSGPGSAHRLVLILAIAVVASAVGYPLRGQLAMYVLAVAGLVIGYLWAGVEMVGPVLLLHVGLLAILALTVGMVSHHLRESRRRTGEARAAAERRARLLQAVSSLSRLDPGETMDAAVDALCDLGFDAAAVNVLMDGRLVPRAHAGFPPDLRPAELARNEGIAGRAWAEDRTVVVDDYRPGESARGPRASVGSVVAAAIPGDGGPAGVVVGARRDPGEVSALLVEVVETVARQAGRMLANAARYDAEQRTAARLVELNQMKSELLASVSSELRAPLTMVRGVSETLHRRPDLLDSDPTLLSRLNANARRLSEMIHDLLDFSRLQAGRYELRGELVDLAELFEETVPPGVEVLSVGRVQVVADRRLLRRAVWHLLFDLRNAFEPHEVRVDGSEDDSGVAVTIELRRKDKLQATGAIGLTLASEILASHGADIELEDVDDRWLRVGFVLRDLVPSGSSSLTDAAP